MNPKAFSQAFSVFAAWTVASFLCHKLAKMAVEVYVTQTTSASPLWAAALVTLFQLGCCYVTLNMTSLRGPYFYVTAFSHGLATLATNSSLALTFASSTLTVKMLEPVSSALLQRVFMRTRLSSAALLSMVAVVGGASLFVGSTWSQDNAAQALALALVSNLTLGVRNVAVKLSHNYPTTANNNGSTSTTTTTTTTSIQMPSPLAGVSGWAVAVLALLILSLSLIRTYGDESLDPRAAVVVRGLAPFLLFALASGACHVTYSFLSAGVVLRHVSVVSHALVNIVKRVLVVLMLYVSGRRPGATAWNWLGLGLCTAGLLAYPSLRATNTGPKTASDTARSDAYRDAEPACGVTSHRDHGHLLRRLLILMTFAFVVIVTPTTMMTSRLYPELDYLWSRGAGQDGRPWRTLELQASGEDGDLVSKIFHTEPRHANRSKSDYALNLRFGYKDWSDGLPLIRGKIPYQPERKSWAAAQEFLSREHLLDTPFDTDGLSPYLTTAQEVVDEAQRVHDNLFRDLFRGKRYAVLFEVASFENKGDAALTVAEMSLLENMGIKLVFYVNLRRCHGPLLFKAMEVARAYPKEETVMLLHGGGNIIAHGFVDRCRERSLRLTRGYTRVIFANSIWMRATAQQWHASHRLYCCSPDLTVLLRDRLSLYIAQRVFTKGTRLVLAPDMAFQLGYIGRFVHPYYDIIWQKRTDHENAIFDKVPDFPPSLKVFVWDWLKMTSVHSDNTVRMAMNVMQHGLGILQQGRVLVTDRLHGHILSTLLGIPHVLLDNADQKLSAYHNTWTRNLANCRLADNAQDAARMALELLDEYRDTLPPRLSVVDIDEFEPQKIIDKLRRGAGKK